MTGIIILAAGASGRFGSPKQNLIYEGQTLIQRAIDTAITTGFSPVIVVLGANHKVIRPGVQNKNAEVVINDDWQEGMSSSIRTGIDYLQRTQKDISSVILMLCDQPFVTSGLLLQLAENCSDDDIRASAFSGSIGPPACFGSNYFPELLSLRGNNGAKQLFRKYPHKVITVPFPLGGTDIDTTDDFNRLKRL
ncbi:MAG TPA: nucleotidyltransferase family protein [Mucilaginibacter sp.]|nr:nucleotidyltransferase family protein [Mucilaginibacter sp.]